MRILKAAAPVLFVVLLGAPLTAQAVTTTPVPCDGDLFGAITIANANPGLDVVKLAAGCTYVLRSAPTNNGLPAITSDLSIVGNGATILRNSTTQFRILEINPGVNVTISKVTVIGGEPPIAPSGAPGNHGGGILNHGTLTLKGVVVTGNVAGVGGPALGIAGNPGGSGGGIYNDGVLKVIGGRVTSNTAGRGSGGSDRGGDGGAGGGIANVETLVLRGVSINTNTAGDAGSGGTAFGVGGVGGGISNGAGHTTTIGDSKIVNNFTGYSDTFGSANGGGINNQGNHINPIRTTIRGNHPDNCAGSGGVSHCVS